MFNNLSEYNIGYLFSEFTGKFTSERHANTHQRIQGGATSGKCWIRHWLHVDRIDRPKAVVVETNTVSWGKISL